MTPFMDLPLIRKILLLLQFSAIPVLFFVRIDSFEKLLNCCLVTISVFMLFAPLYSPQWMLWIFPLMILLTKTNWDVALAVIYGVITYVEFPLAFDYFGPESYEMMIMGWVNIALLALIVFQAIGKIRRRTGTQFALKPWFNLAGSFRELWTTARNLTSVYAGCCTIMYVLSICQRERLPAQCCKCQPPKLSTRHK